MPKMKLGKSSDGREMHYSAGVIVECNGKYLLLDRKNPPPGFACPAGHVDENEEPKVAAIREVFEETGIELKSIEFICEEEIDPSKIVQCQNLIHYWYLYKASVNSENIVIQEEEEKSLAWYTIEEIKKLNLEPVWKYWFEKLKIL